MASCFEKRLLKMLVTFNILLLGFLALAICWGFSSKSQSSTLEISNLCLKSKDSPAFLKLSSEGGEPRIILSDRRGNERLKLFVRNEDSMVQVISQEGRPLISFGDTEKSSAALTINDDRGEANLILEGGKSPGFYIRNGFNQTVGSWTLTLDGGSGIGLAQANGSASTILRGGESPLVAFFSSKEEPSSALGLSQKVPHLFISGIAGNESVLIHGGKPSGLMLVDEEGSVGLFISKDGVFKSREKDKEQPPKKEKYFTFDGDMDKLFPKSRCR